MKLFFKHPSKTHCERKVKAALKKVGLDCSNVLFGEADIRGDISLAQRNKLGKALKKSGIELLRDKKSFLIEKVKNSIAELARDPKMQAGRNFSGFLSKKLKHNYTYLANIFSASEGTTIEQYYISLKIGRVKELLLDDDQNISAIAERMGYSSTAHLSNQFRKSAGLSPTSFRKINAARPSSLHRI